MRYWLTGVWIFAWCIAHAVPASAAPRDANAIKLAEDAINVDYLATNFAEAEKKLRKAINMCGTTACSPQVRARVHRDLGVVLVAGLNRPDDGRAEFVEALKADPGITLDKDLTTPEIEAQFRAAQGGGAAPPPAAVGLAAPGAAPSAPSGAAPVGDMIHTPPPEQVVLTPVPIYAEMPPGVQASKVIARYRPFGSQEWKTLELRRLANGYGGEIPCLDIGSETGDLSYYIQAFGPAGDVVSSSGSRAAPNKVAIKNQLSGEPPRLPGRSPAAQCANVADCPPGLPGCPTGKHAAVVAKGWGASCDHDSECGPGLACKGGSCETGEKAGGEEEAATRSCDTNSDCNADEVCSSGKCEGPGGKGKKIWLSLSVQQDISVVSKIDNVCGTADTLPPPQVLCLAQDGFEYTGIPQSGNGNAVAGGLHLATTRFLAGIDGFLGSNVSLGARVGYVISTGPASPSLSSLHAEARVAYWTGKDPAARKSVRPYVALMGGLAEVDDKFKTEISETKPPDPSQGLFPTQTLTVWRQSGIGFFGAAGGVMIPVSASSGVLVELKLQVLLPNSGFALGPTIGYAVGL